MNFNFNNQKPKGAESLLLVTQEKIRQSNIYISSNLLWVYSLAMTTFVTVFLMMVQVLLSYHFWFFYLGELKLGSTQYQFTGELRYFVAVCFALIMEIFGVFLFIKNAKIGTYCITLIQFISNLVAFAGTIETNFNKVFWDYSGFHFTNFVSFLLSVFLPVLFSIGAIYMVKLLVNNHQEIIKKQEQTEVKQVAEVPQANVKSTITEKEQSVVLPEKSQTDQTTGEPLKEEFNFNTSILYDNFDENGNITWSVKNHTQGQPMQSRRHQTKQSLRKPKLQQTKANTEPPSENFSIFNF